ncbi:MAG: Sel1-repeat containing protein [Gammaproteobacteria bacterium]|jgi:tetratricopeptide (TPR) repeat protein|nr:Sel1-repeat containing protein [Gammaproteobacteria bacterium]
MTYEEIIAMIVNPDEVRPAIDAIIGDDTFVEGSSHYEVVEEAKAGLVNSINNMAEIYTQGTYRIPSNQEKAFKLFDLAAKYGHPSAIFNLAGCYFSGRGIPQNLKIAEELYQKAKKLDPSLKEIEWPSVPFATAHQLPSSSTSAPKP